MHRPPISPASRNASSAGGSAEQMEDFEYWDAALHEAIAEAARNHSS
jgi:DNA-binding FadR family transcriptional regulator